MTQSRLPAPATAVRGPLVPAILATQPNAVRLLKSLSRCWERAVLLAAACATGVAVATWFLMPPAKATARALVRVPPGGIFLFRTAENVPALADHQRNQVAMIKSRLVLSSALKQPEVGRLGIVQKWPEPIEWLEKEVQADFSIAPEI